MCVESHLCEQLEQGFEVALAKDATAAPKHPEMGSFAKMKSGKTYQNRYHFLCEVRGGKIQAVREYLDTMHANEVLC